MFRLLLAPLAALIVLCAWTEDPSVQEIVARSNQAAYYAGKDGRARVSMTITDSSGATRERQMTILRKNDDELDQKFYVYFEGPADVRKMAYLVWKKADGNDDRWLWLPALNLVKRIAPGDKRTSFVGSDFVYEDVSGRSIEEDSHELLENGSDSWKLKSTPKDPGSVEFAFYHLWIDKQTYLPLKAEYYNQSGKLYRRVEALETSVVQGYPTVLKARVSDLGSGSSTTNEFREVTYDLGLDERIFSERFLRRPPREVR
jgi:outer membrane lipoprotein-sorting protein